AACHPEPWSSATMSSRCLDCHTDVRAQLDARGPMHGKLAAGKECRECHTEHKGAHASLTDLATFDHNCARFPLTGKHRAVDCKPCHVDASFKSAPQACAACHAEPKVHKDRFGPDCGKCHSTSTWQADTYTQARFDHNLAAFPLTGKHRAIDC